MAHLHISLSPPTWPSPTSLLLGTALYLTLTRISPACDPLPLLPSLSTLKSRINNNSVLALSSLTILTLASSSSISIPLPLGFSWPGLCGLGGVLGGVYVITTSGMEAGAIESEEQRMRGIRSVRWIIAGVGCVMLGFYELIRLLGADGK